MKQNKRTAIHTRVIRELQRAYAMELETVENYLANSIHLDGVSAEIVKKALADDVATELGHARTLAERIRTLGGDMPGSLANERGQKWLQPPKNSTDVVTIIRGVIRAEEEAIAQYTRIADMCDGVDYVTQDLAIQILGGEEQHRREFIGFLRGYENQKGKV